jgi:hypothetical protein
MKARILFLMNYFVLYNIVLQHSRSEFEFEK